MYIASFTPSFINLQGYSSVKTSEIAVETSYIDDSSMFTDDPQVVIDQGAKGETGESCSVQTSATGYDVYCGGILSGSLSNGLNGAKGEQGEKGGKEGGEPSSFLWGSFCHIRDSPRLRVRRAPVPLRSRAPLPLQARWPWAERNSR